MSKVKEIEAALPKLSRAEIGEIRAGIDDYVEEQLELTDAVKAMPDQSRQEIAAGNHTIRHSELQGRPEFKLRVGNHCALYEFDLNPGRICLHQAGQRRDIYKRS